MNFKNFLQTMRNAYFLCSKQTFYIIRMPISYSRYRAWLFSSISTKSTVDSFLEHLNSLSTSIKFTLEKENNNVLPFLDVLVVRDKQGRLITKVYRKNTHTNKSSEH